MYVSLEDSWRVRYKFDSKFNGFKNNETCQKRLKSYYETMQNKIRHYGCLHLLPTVRVKSIGADMASPKLRRMLRNVPTPRRPEKMGSRSRGTVRVCEPSEMVLETIHGMPLSSSCTAREHEQCFQELQMIWQSRCEQNNNRMTGLQRRNVIIGK
jgi:hypothetical protein